MTETRAFDTTGDAGFGDYVALLKPRVMSLVVFTALVGLLVAPVPVHPFVAMASILFIALGGGAFDFGADGWKSILSAGIAAVVPVVIRWLNPEDKAFGNKA